MIFLANDYNHGAHVAILDALRATNGESYPGYGKDIWCERAATAIKKHLNCPEAEVHFFEGGTQTNVTVIAAALRPYESVLSPDSGHINTHETGAVEHAGHKIEALPATDGKITAKQIMAAATAFNEATAPEHITEPKMVYISQPTEYGTLYSLAELEEIRQVCDAYNLFLFIDGARLAYALTSPACDMTLADLARLTDVFYIGGTKCGALLGEAAVIINPLLKPHFRNCIKQNNGLMAKGWLLGLQFYTLFKDDLYFTINAPANTYAEKIKQAFQKKGIMPYIDSPTNQQFFVLTEAQISKLATNFAFEISNKIDANHKLVRFCTTWSTTADEVEELSRAVAAL